MIVFFCFVLSAFICVSTQQDPGFVELVSQKFTEKINSQLEQQVLSFHKQELALRAYASYFGRADVDLPGFKKLLTNLKGRALDNALATITYINDRGGRVRFPVVQMKDACISIAQSLKAFDVIDSKLGSARSQPYICQFLLSSDVAIKTTKTEKGKRNQNDRDGKVEARNEWKAGLYGLEDALAMEKQINSELLNLADSATKFGDPHTRSRLEHFIEKQVEVIHSLSELITRLRRYNQDDDYILGEYLINNELDS